MRRTQKDRYAANGLTAHRQRVRARPALVAAMERQATLDRITERLMPSRPLLFFDFAAMKERSDRLDRLFYNELAKLTKLPKDRSDDQLDAASYAPAFDARALTTTFT